MRNLIRVSLFASIFLVGVSVAHAQVSVGIGIVIGQPPPPRVVRVLPDSPGPGYFWVAGYWYPVRRHYVWHPGYWTRPPYEGAIWMAPRYDDDRYFEGYWDGPRGRVEHDHRWDHERERDFDHWKHHRDHHDRDDRDDNHQGNEDR